MSDEWVTMLYFRSPFHSSPFTLPAMQPDDELCLCFHVTQRKVSNFLRIEKPRRVAQLSECFGAGTGCGWCRPFLQRLFEAAAAEETDLPPLPSSEDYACQRGDYIRAGGGTPPPGAAPVDPAQS